jgi:membrane-associated phospholipid phosphatase
MALLTHRQPHTGALPLRLRVSRPSPRMTMLGLAAVFLALTVDALFNARAFFDLALLRAVQRIDPPLLDTVLRPIDWAASSEGGIAIWVAMLAALLAARWWLPALALFVVPVGGLINEGFGLLGNHVRPTAAEVERVIGETNAPSFPSGHVAGAVMLYGLLFVVADRITYRPVRLAVKAATLTVIATIGFARLWYGAHWPSDVVAAYALGGMVLLPTLAVYRRLDASVGRLPFIRAAVPAHDEATPHAHALTSLVLFDEKTVDKIYAPGFLPRAIYWAAFQAEFPYLRNQAALRAAQHRRNLAALLTEYWYGSPRVARVTGIDRRADGYAVTSERVDGHAPSDRAAAKAWLRDLRGKFEAAGLPTWQIDPRQPRAVDNVLETADGRYMIVDLESGLVAPIASLRTWKRAVRRGLVPMYDDVFFDVTRAYIAREEVSIRAALGAERTDELIATLNAAEAAALEWHAGEPRIWSRILRSAQRGFGVRDWPAWVQAKLEGSQDKAQAWLAGAIDTWEAEGRATPAEAERMRAHMNGAEFQAMLPHLGAHIVISIILRFPFGSIARVAWSTGVLLAATGRLLARRIDRAAWKQTWSVHSPLVIALAAIPGFGTFAYLAAKPVRSNRLLFRAAADTALRKTPWRLYDRIPLQRLIARPAGAATAAAPVTQPVTVRPERWIVPEPGFVAAMLGDGDEEPRRVIPFRPRPGKGTGDGSLPRTRTGPSIGDPASLPAA